MTGELVSAELSTNYLECNENEAGEKTYMQDHVHGAYITLAVLHAICFVFMLIEEIVTSNFSANFFHHLIMLPTVPLYQYAIFQACYDISNQERLVQAANCISYPFMQRRAWLYIEIITFMANIILLMVGLLQSFKPCGGGGCCLCFKSYKFEKILNEDYDTRVVYMRKVIEGIVKKTKEQLNIDLMEEIQENRDRLNSFIKKNMIMPTEQVEK